MSNYHKSKKVCKIVDIAMMSLLYQLTILNILYIVSFHNADDRFCFRVSIKMIPRIGLGQSIIFSKTIPLYVE
jgi:hypothetical protein